MCGMHNKMAFFRSDCTKIRPLVDGSIFAGYNVSVAARKDRESRRRLAESKTDCGQRGSRFCDVWAQGRELFLLLPSCMQYKDREGRFDDDEKAV